MASPSSLGASSSLDRPFFIINAVVSTAALALLTYLLLLRHAVPGTGPDLHVLPAVNASLNGISATLLLAGFVAIRQNNWRLHRTLMIGAFVASSLFLVSYLAYHAVHGDTHYRGTGLLRGVYFFILVTHILLSATVVPMVLTTFYFAARRQWARHKRLNRFLLPIWLYVSVTGVAVFFLLRSSYQG